MIIASPRDFRRAAQQRLPRFLFDYVDGGALDEVTLKANETDLSKILLRQRVLHAMDKVDLSTTLLGQDLALPITLGPVGLSGMLARRGEVQAAQAAAKARIPYTLSTVSVCPLAEIAAASSQPIWFQLYVLKDRGFMADALARAAALGVTTLVFTVDMPTPGSRYRDPHSGMSGPWAGTRRLVQAMLHPRWALDVGLLGRPHDLGNISVYRGQSTGLADYIGWLGANFDPSIGWQDLDWIRQTWQGQILIKGILDPDDARDAVSFGADGIVVSNHGGRQLDGTLSTAAAMPGIVEAVGKSIPVLADSGIRSGVDVLRFLALGADAVMLGRAYAYALAAGGEAGVSRLLALFEAEMRTNMTLMGVKKLADLGPHCLVQPSQGK
ncbi:FMN-dependent L-lactate dehydrogenase LldD [Aquidulcibacter sp.]|uniref:FMN-dependent L-lactate dehydrogenase LldD n=1 Tax=Aquidulcibacter sp. TaxID=2052990 RepID=UPI0025BD8F17|nr:FMN-dependent L-lactate dehydrogenase LldD [Aquidulcibacter sp.]MCA3694306.1 FMN-dependent L-lactate dehydrogenase LldD [Aquidulcibacter sp.]